MQATLYDIGYNRSYYIYNQLKFNLEQMEDGLIVYLSQYPGYSYSIQIQIFAMYLYLKTLAITKQVQPFSIAHAYSSIRFRFGWIVKKQPI